MKKQICFIFELLLIAMVFCACGKTKTESVTYTIVDGRIVSSNEDLSAFSAQNEVQTEKQEEIVPGSSAAAEVSDGVAYTENTANALRGDSAGKMSVLRAKLITATDACRATYLSVNKGETKNITISTFGIAQMLSDIAGMGYPAMDYLGELNMQGYETLDAFARTQRLSGDDISGTYFVVYSDGHLSGFCLSRESGVWHVYSMSAAWNEDGSIRIYSEGRYAVGSVQYTEKGWLIYTRDTSDFDENLKANTDSYVMIRVLPQDSEAKNLCRKYVEPVGYLENNLFTTNWSENDFGPVDFNSLYAYVFSLYNGTEMLSSYNVRTYYKAVGGTKLYLVPKEIFENNTQVYFRVDSSVLRNISDYNSELGGYFFLGYNRDYYNVPPRTPSPEVVSYSYNNDGTITMVVDAVNSWYGTDCAFEHVLTVRPGTGNTFQYVSNTLVASENNILPAMKLSEMLNVERAKTTY